MGRPGFENDPLLKTGFEGGIFAKSPNVLITTLRENISKVDRGRR
jgi:hypothetical protein